MSVMAGRVKKQLEGKGLYSPFLIMIVGWMRFRLDFLHFHPIPFGMCKYPDTIPLGLGFRA